MHGFSHRTGGVSEGAFSSLNTGLHVGDERESVVENRTRVARACDFGIENVICAEQVHGARAARVDATFAGRGATVYADALPGVDALISDTPGVLLSLFFADCLPVFFVDPTHRAVGIAHAGWKGLASSVLQNTITAMADAWQTAPADLLVAIGPGIGVAHFEVGPEVAAQFPQDTVWFDGQEKPRVDLPSAAARILQAAGVHSQNITVSADCTYTLPARYFSHRRDASRTGRMMGVIGVVP